MDVIHVSTSLLSPLAPCMLISCITLLNFLLAFSIIHLAIDDEKDEITRAIVEYEEGLFCYY